MADIITEIMSDSLVNKHAVDVFCCCRAENTISESLCDETAKVFRPFWHEHTQVFMSPVSTRTWMQHVTVVQRNTWTCEQMTCWFKKQKLNVKCDFRLFTNEKRSRRFTQFNWRPLIMNTHTHTHSVWRQCWLAEGVWGEGVCCLALTSSRVKLQ